MRYRVWKTDLERNLILTGRFVKFHLLFYFYSLNQEFASKLSEENPALFLLLTLVLSEHFPKYRHIFAIFIHYSPARFRCFSYHVTFSNNPFSSPLYTGGDMHRIKFPVNFVSQIQLILWQMRLFIRKTRC